MVAGEQELVAVVLGTASRAGADLARGLAEQGFAVGESASVAPGSSAEVERDLAAAVARLGPPDLVVVPVLPADGEAARRASVAELDEGGWEQACEVPLRTARWGLVAAYRALAVRGGVIVVIGPMAGTVGEAGRVGYGAAGEGARALVRSCSRTWGAAGVRVHSVVVPTSLLVAGAVGIDGTDGPEHGADGLDDQAEAERSSLWDEALGRPPTLRGDVAAVAAGLAGPALAFTTGTSVAVDGGGVLHT